MAITSGFFNSVDGDRLYNARDISMYFNGLVSDGVYENVGAKLQVTAAGGGMKINVGSGRALIDCQWFNNDATETLTLDPASVSASRVDAVVLRLDLTDSGRAITLFIKRGTEFTSGRVVPPLVWNAEIKEFYLAQINVKAGKTAITQADIVDTRGTIYCPYVTGLIKQVDTAELFAQYQSACEQYFNDMTTAFNAYIAEKQQAFNNWFSDLTEQLHVDNAVLKYQDYKEITGDLISLPLSQFIPEYENGDIVLIHIGGVMLTEGVDYNLNHLPDVTLIEFINQIKQPASGKIPLTIIVLKSVIGGSVVSAEIDEINGVVI